MKIHLKKISYSLNYCRKQIPTTVQMMTVVTIHAMTLTKNAKRDVNNNKPTKIRRRRLAAKRRPAARKHHQRRVAPKKLTGKYYWFSKKYISK